MNANDPDSPQKRRGRPRKAPDELARARAGEPWPKSGPKPIRIGIDRRANHAIKDPTDPVKYSAKGTPIRAPSQPEMFDRMRAKMQKEAMMAKPTDEQPPAETPHPFGADDDDREPPRVNMKAAAAILAMAKGDLGSHDTVVPMFSQKQIKTDNLQSADEMSDTVLTNTIERMAGVGVSAEDIGFVLGIPRLTLVRDYGEIMSRGRAKSNLNVSQSLYSVATDKAHSKFAQVAIFWAQSRMGWSTTPSEKAPVENADAQVADGMATEADISARFLSLAPHFNKKKG